MDMIRRFASPTRRNEEGASAVEYGLLVALIAAVVVIAVFALGTVVKKTFNDTCKGMATNGATGTTVTSADCKS